MESEIYQKLVEIEENKVYIKNLDEQSTSVNETITCLKTKIEKNLKQTNDNTSEIKSL